MAGEANELAAKAISLADRAINLAARTRLVERSPYERLTLRLRGRACVGNECINGGVNCD